jgi:hypothetical protein
MSAIKEQSPRAQQKTPTRQLKVGKWVESLKNSDVNQLWTELHRIVCHHPLVRASRSAGLLIEEGKQNAYSDLTQELFVALLSKERFQHYLDSEMTNAEIEAEISQIELTNLLTAELRKRYPESYRLARRISNLIQTSKKFRRFDKSGLNGEPHRRLADRTYGLSEWPESKHRLNQPELEERVHKVPIVRRDTRMVGCTGDAQIVINNVDLEELIIRVLTAIDSPVDVRMLRSLVMSRLPVMDIYLVPIGGSDDSEENPYQFDPVDSRENPEQSLIRMESEGVAAGFVDKFLSNLNKSVRNKVKQYNRIVSVLWHCYLSPAGNTQLEVADMLGVSDSLVSDYRRRIESLLQQLDFHSVEEARQFEQALKKHVRVIVETEEREKITV